MCGAQVYAVDWSPDGERLVSGSKDCLVKMYVVVAAAAAAAPLIWWFVVTAALLVITAAALIVLLDATPWVHRPVVLYLPSHLMVEDVQLSMCVVNGQADTTSHAPLIPPKRHVVPRLAHLELKPQGGKCFALS